MSFLTSSRIQGLVLALLFGVALLLPTGCARVEPALVDEPVATVALPGYARLSWGGTCTVVDIACSFHTGKVDCKPDEICVAKRNADCSYDKPRCKPRKRPAGGAIPDPAIVVTP